MAITEHNIVTQASFEYETVAASQTDQVLGTTGAAGDRIERLVITSNTAATATVTLKDGAGATFPLLVGAATTPLGVFTVHLGLNSVSGAWTVTTGAGATVVAIGRFTN